MYIGIDIGAISIKVVVLDADLNILEERYVRIEGNPLLKAYLELNSIFEKFQLPNSKFQISATGSGSKLLADILGIPFVNEVIAQARGTYWLHPEVKSIIEIGGQDSKFISLESRNGVPVVSDFAMNTLCAAGTGSFLDQQAARLGLKIDEFGHLGLTAKTPTRIAGRCSVFANSDMIHLQQEGTPIEDIVCGLCFALARNFKSVIARGKKFIPPVSFQGGVAFNLGMRRALKELLEISEEEFIVPRYFASIGAIGAVLETQTAKHLKSSMDKPQPRLGVDLEKIPEFIANHRERCSSLPRLILNSAPPTPIPDYRLPITNHQLPVWLGIDVGSISTNVVLIDENKNLVARKYLWTQGKPIEAVLRGLQEISEEVGDKVEVRGVGVTGSGRYMIGDIVGADLVKNEITSQARASIEIDPAVDTIFEIGGQDSKYISLRNGAITDFEMNKVCAAGTGSFLEEQAARLNLNIVREFADCAFKSSSPIALGDRCTVFIESSLVSYQQKGVARDDLAAGLAYSIAQNYLTKVVGNKKIGDNIFFQGAVAHNRAIVAAFEQLIDKRITVPPNNDVTGAIGVAILAQEFTCTSHIRHHTSFKGFDLYKKEYNIDKFECKGCPNQCEIKKVSFESAPTLYYGGRCEKYETRQTQRSQRTQPDLFELREKLLIQQTQRTQLTNTIRKLDSRAHPTIGIPRALMMMEYLPFWVAFFRELGCKVVVSSHTNKKIIQQGVATCRSEHCFPVKVCHGHILDLAEKEVNYIFLPSFISLEKEYEGITECYACPFVQAIPYVIKSTIHGVKLLSPVLYLKRGKKWLEKTLTKLGNQLGKSRDDTLKAISTATKAQDEFYRSIKEEGSKILTQSRQSHDSTAAPTFVLVGRPYNTCDTGLNLGIPQILSELNVQCMPMDFLPIENVSINGWGNMYWRCGQRILATAKLIREHSNLYPVFITNFGCGADSFIQKYFEQVLADKPHLIIEVDEHSAPAGVRTRLEAFIDSIKTHPSMESSVAAPFTGAYVGARGATSRLPRPSSGVTLKNPAVDLAQRTLLIPFMGNHSEVVAAAFRHCGIQAQVMPQTDEPALALGRKWTTGKECLPCILTTGDMLKTLQSHPAHHDRVAFFMPQSNGPCRFGQYNKLQRIILDELGYKDVPIVSPNQADRFLESLKEYGNDFLRRVWVGMCAVDVVERVTNGTRPYEVNKGDTDRVKAEALNLICSAVEGRGDIIKVMPMVKEILFSIPVKQEVKPRIGITGEIYVRSHPFANDYIVRRIEELGGEAIVASTCEWFFYTNTRRIEDSLADKNYRALFIHWLQGKWQRWSLNKVQKGVDVDIDEPTTQELFTYSNPYLHQTVEGEAVLTVGKCIEFIHEGIDGIIIVGPFTCMPTTNAAAVMQRVVEKYKIPYLDIFYDGFDQPAIQTRLEAFMWQAHQYKTAKVRR